ncbi:MAG: Hpt domain-containing protein [Alphaproteobacteria bacterium]|nr:Hpt domain-containing protein [Alphaproteobacteria bacterium]
MAISLIPQPPVDLQHLARYTGGDPVLDSEILRLFVKQSAELMAELPAALATGDRERWHHIAHSLKGAARGIGAFEFADIAAEADALNPVGAPGIASELISKLQMRMAAVHDFVQDFAVAAT